MRAAIFGDVGGQLIPFAGALQQLGVSLENGQMPDDLIVVQAGDLIHKGPYSSRLVRMVDGFMHINPGQWIQLAGNHEAQHLGGYEFWECMCSDELIETLGFWRDNEKLRAAVAFTSDPVKKILTASQTLVTHAGITRQFSTLVGADVNDSQSIAHNLNEAFLSNQPVIHRAGSMLGMGVTAFAGPLWAQNTSEVYPSWKGHLMPYNQVHGHTLSYIWNQHRWGGWTPKEYRKVMHAYADKSIATFEPLPGQGGMFAGIDPGYEEITLKEGIMPYLLVENFVELKGES